MALGVVVLGAFTLATAGPRGPAAGPADTPALAGAVVQPVVTSVSPSSGLSIGGTPVTITGSGFTGATAVTFNGTNAVSYTVVSPTQITAVTPEGIPGPATVRVAIGTCLSAVSGSTFTYLPMFLPPIASSMTPASGPTAGGTTVTINGAYLSGAATVNFGGVLGQVSSSSASSVTAVAPAHAAGNVGVVVLTLTGIAAVPGGYTYVDAPSVTSLAPTSGSTAGGTSVTITGTGFTAATGVSFGGTPATSFTVDSSTQITAVTPAGSAGPADLEVTGPGGTDTVAGGYTFATPPTLTSLAPSVGTALGGTTVVITGTGLTGASAVTFGGTPATSFTVDSATQITAVAPAGLGTVAVAAVTPTGTASLPGAYTYLPPIAAAAAVDGVHQQAAQAAAADKAVKAPASGKAAATATASGKAAATVPASGKAAATVPASGKAAATATASGKAAATVPASGKAAATAPVSGKAALAAPVSGKATVAAPVSGKAAKGGDRAKVRAKARTGTHTAKTTAAPRMERVFFQMPAPACPAPPSAPSPVTATPGTSSIAVSWTAATPHDSPITGYTATATPGPATCTTLITDPDPLSCVLGATAGQQYTVSVVANSAEGASDPATSSAVIPVAPVVPAAPPDTPLTLTTDKGAISSAEPGQDIVVIGSGFAAYSTATITLYSAPITLGTVVTDAGGNFTKPVTVPRSLAAGVHTLVAQGVAPTGNPRAMKLTVSVAAAAATGGLAVTGAPTGPLALAGLVMVLTGLGLLGPWPRRIRPRLR